VLKRIVESVFPVRAGERRLTLALFLHSLFAVGAFLTGRTVRDALFLVNGDREQLAWMYVASAIAVTLSGLVYAPLAAKVRRDKVALGTALTFSLIFVAAWFVERAGQRWIYSALYVFVEVMGALCLVQFWTLANELFNAREARRLYGLIGTGGTMANIVVGLAAAKIATQFGASALLWLAAALLAGTAGASFMAGRLGRERIFAKQATGKISKGKRAGGAMQVITSGHLRTVAILAAITFFTTTLVDFEFKIIAAKAFPKNELAAFFGYFSAVVGALALGLQLFGTGKLLNRAGVIAALMVLPVSLAVGNFALAIVPALWAASIAKGSDTLFRYSINDATTQILYLPVPPQARATCKAFIDGVIKPISIGLCGLALAAYKSWGPPDPSTLAWLALVCCGAWIANVARLKSQYIRSLQDNLRQSKLDLDSSRSRVGDGATQSVLVKALESGDPTEALGALKLLPQLEDLQLDHRVEPLLDHATPEIRIAALEYFGRRRTMRYANSIYRLFEDPDRRVCAAAIDAFCSLGQDKAVRSVRRFLTDDNAAVRAAAVTGMIRYGGLDGVLAAAEALKALIAHQEAVMRQHAAQVLGAIGVKNFYQPVLELMSDPDPAVRRHAIQAAGVLRAPELVIPLIYKTGSSETMGEAVEALSAFGPAILPTLGKVLDNGLEALPIRCAVARVLGRMATPEAVAVITRHLEEPEEELRARLYRALARSVRGRQGVPLTDRKAVETALSKELERAYNTLQQAETLSLGVGPQPHTPRQGPKAAEALLASALIEKVAQIERRAFVLLAVLYPEANMEGIYGGIRDALAADAARRRANAVELLDNLLDRRQKKLLLPLLDDIPRSARLRQITDEIAIAPLSRGETLRLLSKDETAWVRACAVWYSAHTPQGDGLSAEAMVASSNDASPVVREISLVALAQTAPDQVAAIAEARLTDEAPVVRQCAALISTRLAAAG
jgi:ATP/ADP translocase/HEAT repeat protein